MADQKTDSKPLRDLSGRCDVALGCTKTLWIKPESMSTEQITKEIDYWVGAKFAGPKTKARVLARVEHLKKALASKNE